MCQTVRVGRGTRRLRTHGTGPAGATGPCPLLPEVYLAPGSGAGTAWGTKVARKLGKAETRQCGTEFAGAPGGTEGWQAGPGASGRGRRAGGGGGLAGQPVSGFWDHSASAVRHTEKRPPASRGRRGQMRCPRRGCRPQRRPAVSGLSGVPGRGRGLGEQGWENRNVRPPRTRVPITPGERGPSHRRLGFRSMPSLIRLFL